MNEQEIEQAAEIVGALKDLFREFESRLGEIVSAQRIASSEARAEGAKVAKDLHELSSAARTLIDEQRALVSRLEREWQLRIDGNAQRAGEAQAKAFGENIARGLQGRLEELAADVATATRRFTWQSSLPWALGIAIAIPLTVDVCLSVLSPHVEPSVAESRVEQETVEKLAKPSGIPGMAALGLTAAQTREVAARLSWCQLPTADWHVCIAVDNPPRMGLGSTDKPRMVVRGM